MPDSTAPLATACIARSPQLGIDIGIAPESRRIDASAPDGDALGGQPGALLHESFASRVESDAAVCTHHPMPWQTSGITGFAKDTSDQSRAARQPRLRGNLAITGDTTARNRTNGAHDRLAPLRCGIFAHVQT